MPLWYAVLLGIVQGLTEFLPISSTAHLRILPALIGQPDPGAAYTAVIQLGTLAAVIWYFRSDILKMTRGLLIQRGGPEAKLALQVVLGTIPIGVVGLAFKDYIVGPLRSLWVISATLILVGLLMAVADRLGRRKLGTHDLSWGQALLVGVAQACAVMPGVSRSGSTMTAALAMGMKRDEAARFSFLLSIPAIGAAGVFEMKDAIHELGSSALPALAVGTGVSFIVGYASIVWLLRFLGTRSMTPFVIYRVALGLLLFALVGGGVLQP